MARRRSADDADVENGKKKEEEIDTYQTVYIDTNLDTHLALVASHFDSVLDLKSIDFSPPFNIFLFYHLVFFCFFIVRYIICVYVCVFDNVLYHALTL